jgi:molecular chaperone HscB
LTVNLADLEQRYRALSRQFHPDYFHNAPPAERRTSLEQSSYLNDAYRTLKDPLARVEYLLRLEGVSTAQAGAAQRAPAALLEQMFALNEELDDIRSLKTSGASRPDLQERIGRARRSVDERRQAHEHQLRDLSLRWDALLDAGASGAAEDARKDVLQALRERMLERNYISNLLATIEREL